MQSEATQLAFFYRVWAWFETHRKQALQGAVAVLAVAFVVSFYLWHRAERETSLSQQFATTFFNQPNATSEFLSLASAHPNTGIAPRALLLAAGNLFADGKYPDAQAQFQKFANNYPDNPFISVALLGIASSLDAQGKTDAAVLAYQNVINRYPNDAAALQARFGLARLYESQNKLSQAVQLYEDVARGGGMGTLGSEAAARMHDLRAKLPALAPSSATLPGTSTFNLKTP